MLEKRQENKLSSHEDVLEILSTNRDKCLSIPVLDAAVTELGSLVAQIKVKAGEKADATAGKTEAKNRAEEQLINSLTMVCGSLRGLARKEKDDTLMEKVSMSRSAYERMRDQELVIKAGSIAELADSRAADLADRGTTAEKLAALKLRIENYKSALSAQGGSVAQRQGASKSVADLFRDTDELLQDEIDGLMEHMQEDYPQFYAEYHLARQIKDLGIRHSPATEEPENAPAA